MSNTFGTVFRLTTFGESHGPAIGGVIDGCPAGIRLDMDSIREAMSRRRPGQSAVSTARKESDDVQILSGVYNGITTGTPIGFVIENKDRNSGDYAEIAQVFRPNHADFTYYKKYRGFNDPRGGGRSSARETAARVFAGAVARQVLKQLCPELVIAAYTHQIGDISLERRPQVITREDVEGNSVRCPERGTAERMEELILKVKAEGNTVGGIVRCVIRNCPVGIGEPVFDKLSARLAYAMMSINAAKGFEIGDGFQGAQSLGSEVLDAWIPDDYEKRGMRTSSNHSGGIQGGISNGEDIVFSVAFKPVATLVREVETVDKNGKKSFFKARGRHDPCVVPRAVPVVEAMAEMTLLDLILLNRAVEI